MESVKFAISAVQRVSDQPITASHVLRAKFFTTEDVGQRVPQFFSAETFVETAVRRATSTIQRLRAQRALLNVLPAQITQPIVRAVSTEPSLSTANALLHAKQISFHSKEFAFRVRALATDASPTLKIVLAAHRASLNQGLFAQNHVQAINLFLNRRVLAFHVILRAHHALQMGPV